MERGERRREGDKGEWEEGSSQTEHKQRQIHTQTHTLIKAYIFANGTWVTVRGRAASLKNSTAEGSDALGLFSCHCVDRSPLWKGK